MNNTFDDFYEVNDSWQSYTPNPLNTLRAHYPSYFDAHGNVDYQKIKLGLMLPNNAQNSTQKKHAHEMFLNCFMMSHKTMASTIKTPALLNIEAQFGGEILAHGVEESKGGMCNLLMMAVTGVVQSSQAHFGPLVEDAPPNISSFGHGPYYLIYSMPPERNPGTPNYPSLSEIVQILVPFDKNKIMISEKLSEMLGRDLITTETRDAFIAKLITYKAYDNYLQSLPTKKHTRSTSARTEFSMFDPSPEMPKSSDENESNPNTLGA